MLTVLTGRSRRLWPVVVAEMGRALQAGEERLLLLTPDQYTLQAELELVTRLNLPGLLRAEVLSPSRLMQRVFALAGAPQRVRVDARGKAMVLSDVLRLHKKELLYYAGAANRPGFTDRLSGMIADFKRAGMGPEAVLALAETFSLAEGIRAKLTDVAALYARYEERLFGAFLDGEDAQEALLERLPESGAVGGARVWIFGFDLISPQFLRQIAVMARLASSVRLSLTLEDEAAPDGAAFAPARETLARLGRYFDREGLLWERVRVNADLMAAPEIRHLERELFAVSPAAFSGKPRAVALWAAANPYDEAMRTAAAMLLYARGGVRFDEMAVVLGDLDAYTGAIEAAFARSGVPFHLARKRPALLHPLLRAWVAALRCATRGFRADDALAWLKGGFCALSPDETERLETYAVENGLRGTKWQRRIGDAELDALRVRFTAPIFALSQRLRDAKDTEASLAAVYGVLEDVDAHRTLEAWQRDLTARGLFVQAADCGQAWRIALETLDQLHALLHGSRLPMAGVAQVIEAGLSAAELGEVPATPGTAQVGQLGHVKLGGGIRVLFLLGMQDGVLSAGEASLLSDAEAARAAEAAGDGAAFGLRGDALAALSQSNLLDTLAAPSERLFISHSLAGAGGEAQRPAAVLRLIRRVFPEMEERGGATGEKAFWHAPGAALDALGPALLRAAARGGELSEAEAEAAAWLLHAPETRATAERILRALEEPPAAQALPRRAANALYAHTRTSVSRLETFAHCPYRHFVDYGLRPVKRREFAVAREETGTFYHRAMEGYAKAAAAHGHWPEITREENDALMDGVLSPLKAEWEDAPLGDNAMLRATGEAFCRVARRAAWTYAGQMRRGGFRTRVIEARFGPGEALPPVKLTLWDGQICYLEGRIDRIDFFEGEGEQWLRVVDYKSGGVTLEPAKVYGGLQLQLLLYLAAALGAFPGVKAAGAFYSRFDDPLVPTDSRDVEEIERQIAKALRLRGIALSEVRVAAAMEDGEDLLKKDGGMKKRGDTATEEELQALMRHAYRLAARLAAQIAAGEIGVRPAQLQNWRACQWCEYAGVCGFDPACGGESRRLLKMGKDELLARVMEENG